MRASDTFWPGERRLSGEAPNPHMACDLSMTIVCDGDVCIIDPA